MDRKTFLKVKLNSLMAEAKIISREEKKNKALVNELYRHRKDVVGYESRHTLLAYCFLKGKKYKQIEQKAKKAPNWLKVEKMVLKYGLDIVNGIVYNEAQQKSMLSKDLQEWIKGE